MLSIFFFSFRNWYLVYGNRDGVKKVRWISEWCELPILLSDLFSWSLFDIALPHSHPIPSQASLSTPHTSRAAWNSNNTTETTSISMSTTDLVNHMDRSSLILSANLNFDWFSINCRKLRRFSNLIAFHFIYIFDKLDKQWTLCMN